jgi:hypothetical protein
LDTLRDFISNDLDRHKKLAARSLPCRPPADNGGGQPLAAARPEEKW